MITPEIGTSIRFSIRRTLVAAAVLASLVTACKDSNNLTGTTAPTTLNLAGAWVGGFLAASDPSFYGDPHAATANLQQSGTSVDGTILITGSPAITIHATVSGNSVSGTIEDESGSGTAQGRFVGIQLTLALHPHLASGAGTLTLHR
jgi:hypothetical protein